MVTSRTGTSVHKRMVAKTLTAARAQGVTHCPGCNNELDYEDRTSKHGAHADEIVPYAVRGYTSTDINDWQVLCATCNQRKGKKIWEDGEPPYPLSREW